jgi:hypothetical protein
MVEFKIYYIIYTSKMAQETVPFWDEINQFKSDKILVTSQNQNVLHVTVRGLHANIEALIEIKKYKNSLLPPTVRVIRPRLALGRNVSFGGLVTYEDLNRQGGIINPIHVLKYTLFALYHEIPDLIHMSDYTTEEFKAAYQKLETRHDPRESHKITRSRDAKVVISPDMPITTVGISNKVFGSKERDFIIEVDHKDIHGRYFFKPMDIKEKEIALSPLQVINLNLRAGDRITYKLVEKKILTKNEYIVVRPRSVAYVDVIMKAIHGTEVICGGHTISYADEDMIKYIDIMHMEIIGSPWCCIEKKKPLDLYDIRVQDVLK